MNLLHVRTPVPIGWSSTYVYISRHFYAIGDAVLVELTIFQLFYLKGYFKTLASTHFCLKYVIVWLSKYHRIAYFYFDSVESYFVSPLIVILKSDHLMLGDYFFYFSWEVISKMLKMGWVRSPTGSLPSLCYCHYEVANHFALLSCFYLLPQLKKGKKCISLGLQITFYSINLIERWDHVYSSNTKIIFPHRPKIEVYLFIPLPV